MKILNWKLKYEFFNNIDRKPFNYEDNISNEIYPEILVIQKSLIRKTNLILKWICFYTHSVCRLICHYIDPGESYKNKFAGGNIKIVHNQNTTSYHQYLNTSIIYFYGCLYIIGYYYRTVCLYRYLSMTVYFFYHHLDT